MMSDSLIQTLILIQNSVFFYNFFYCLLFNFIWSFYHDQIKKNFVRLFRILGCRGGGLFFLFFCNIFSACLSGLIFFWWNIFAFFIISLLWLFIFLFFFSREIFSVLEVIVSCFYIFDVMYIFPYFKIFSYF